MANGTTKAVNLTEDEIKMLMVEHGRELAQFNPENVLEIKQDKIERIGYLNRRLKAFNEPEKSDVLLTSTEAAPAVKVAGW